jgi:(E)-4-hydroxy-3-methylbut-2-enyl-diphosphate synthase
MFLRNQTRKVKIKNLTFGDNILIQSMLTTKTSNTFKVIQEINNLEKIGCDLIRVSCLDLDDCNAIKEIVQRIARIVITTISSTNVKAFLFIFLH